MTTHPTDLPVEINRPLNEQEKSLLCWLAIQTVREQTGVDEQAIADELDEIAAAGQAQFKANAEFAAIYIADFPLVFTTREWLAFVCMWSTEQPEDPD
jgi:hypothetical protein